MSFAKFKNWLALLAVLMLVACGGGSSGDSGSPVLPGTGSGSDSGGGTGTGTTTQSPTVAVAISSPTITPASPATVTVTVRDVKGNPITGVVVDLNMPRGGLAKLGVASLATDSNGSATTTLEALTSGASGADEVAAVAKLGTTTVQGSASFTVAGSQPTIGLTISSTTLRGSTGAAVLSAVVRDAAGAVVPDAFVSFSALANRISLGAQTAKTDRFGVTSVTATVLDPSVSAADTLTAAVTVAGVAIQSSLVVQIVADAPTLTLTAAQSNLSSGQPVTLSALVTDATGRPVGAGTVVTIKSGFALTAFDAVTASTNSSGIAIFSATPQSATSNGADQITATAAYAGITVSGQAVVQVSATASSNFVTLTISPATITSGSPATVTISVQDARGNPVPSAVVDLATSRSGLATLSVASVATAANGQATAMLSAVSGARGGADQLVGTLTTGTTSVQGSASYVVAGSVATVRLSSSTPVLKASAGSATLTATVTDAAGNPIPSIAVSFVSVNGNVVLSAGSAVTNAVGQASVSGSIANAGLTAAETLTASATIGAATVQGSTVLQLQSDIPTISLALSNPSVSTSLPAILSVTVQDSQGNRVKDAIVVLGTGYGLAAFDATTIATDATGVARVFVTPKTATSNGADQINATTTVGGVSVSKQAVVQVLSIPALTVAVDLSSPTVTAANPATVTVKVRDVAGNPVPGAVVDLSTVRGTLARLSVSSVATDSTGNASAQLTALLAGQSGADQVVGALRGSAGAAQGQASFTVLGSAPVLNLNLSPNTALRGSTGPATLTAVVRDAGGSPVPDVQVSFVAVGSKVVLGSPTAKTNAAGQAVVSVSTADAGVTVADTVTANAVVAGSAVQSAIVVQTIADTPSMVITASNSNLVTAALPATLTILVKDAGGVPVGFGTIVQVSSLFGLSTLDANTLSTDGTGTARVTVTPRTPTSNGADQIVARATVGGVAISQQVVVNVSSSTLSAPPLLQTALSSTSISSASPAVVTATLTDGKGQVVPGEVITFTVVRGLATTNIGTALTDASGRAVVVLSPVATSTAGADEVTARTRFAGTDLQSTKGFQIQATNVSLTTFTSAVPSLGAYGQTTLTLTVTGAAPGSPVAVSVSSSCVLQGKATLSPSSFTATTSSVDLQYKDNGCGALQTEDRLLASIVGGTGSSLPLTLPITTPDSASLAFVSASPEVIFLKGSGFTETSTVVFELRDRAGNTLPNRDVTLNLLSDSTGLLLEGGVQAVTRKTDASGRVSVQINSGTVPTPVRIQASLAGSVPLISTVSSNLSVAVGLPSQLNFSLSQRTVNIEGWNIDGTPNTYTIIASDRNGNPVPTGTSINFVTEGGQIEAVAQTSVSPVAPVPGVGGSAGTGTALSTASARYQSASPRPDDGRVTVTVYALGEESFLDGNGNNRYDTGEPFQDLGDLFKDRLFDGLFDLATDELIPLGGNRSSACIAPNSFGAVQGALLALNTGMPSRPATCDGTWSGPGGVGATSVYVRRSVETVLSTSAARAHWASKSGLDASCGALTLQTGSQVASVDVFTPVRGDTWYTGGVGVLSTSLPFIVADANTFPAVSTAGAVGRLNPMAAGTTVRATTPTTGLTVTVGGGTPVPSTSEATQAVIGVAFDPTIAPTQGVVFVSFTSPSGLVTTYAITVVRGARPTACP